MKKIVLTQGGIQICDVNRNLKLEKDVNFYRMLRS